MGFIAAVPLSSDTLRRRMIATLSERLDSAVELGDLQLRVFPGLRAEGKDLIIRKNGRTDVPPLIAIKGFSVDATLTGLWRKHVANVQLEGLEISVPPDHGDLNDHSKESSDNGQGRRAGRADEESLERTVVIDTLQTRDARLVIVPGRPNKTPKVWAIHTLEMHNVGANEAMPFQATLTNGVPPGEITTSGTFGPWERDDPGLTPLDGIVRFRASGPERVRGNLRHAVLQGLLRRHARSHPGRRRNPHAGLHPPRQRASVRAARQIPVAGGRDQRRHAPREDRRELSRLAPAGERGGAGRPARSAWPDRHARREARQGAHRGHAVHGGEGSEAADDRRPADDDQVPAAARRDRRRRSAATRWPVRDCQGALHEN